MTKVIHYYQMIPTYGENGEVDGEEKVIMKVESDNDDDFNEQIETIKTYCGDDYTVEEVEPPKTPIDVIGEQITNIQLALVEIFEQGTGGAVVE